MQKTIEGTIYIYNLLKVTIVILFQCTTRSSSPCLASAVHVWFGKIRKTDSSEGPLTKGCIAVLVPVFQCDPGLDEGRGLGQHTCTNVCSMIPVRRCVNLSR